MLPDMHAGEDRGFQLPTLTGLNIRPEPCAVVAVTVSGAAGWAGLSHRACKVEHSKKPESLGCCRLDWDLGPQALAVQTEPAEV